MTIPNGHEKIFIKYYIKHLQIYKRLYTFDTSNRTNQITQAMITDRLYDTTGNKKVSEPIYDQDEFEDILITSNQHDKYVDIKYESYEYDGAVRIVSLKVNLNGLFEHNFDYLEDQVIEAIGLRLNKHNIVLETKMQLI